MNASTHSLRQRARRLLVGVLDKRAGHYARGVTGMYPCSVAPVSRPVEANLSDSLLGVGRSSCVPVSASGNVARSC